MLETMKISEEHRNVYREGYIHNDLAIEANILFCKEKF